MAERDDEVALLDQRIEDRLFRALLEYPRLAQLLTGQLSESDFSTQIKANLFRVLLWHWEKFGDAPTGDTIRIEAEEMFGGMVPSRISR